VKPTIGKIAGFFISQLLFNLSIKTYSTVEFRVVAFAVGSHEPDVAGSKHDSHLFLIIVPFRSI
jgi:hypothetical protein